MDLFDAMEEMNRPTVHKKPWMEGVELLLGTEELLEQIEQEIMQAGRTSCDLETTGLDCRAFPTASGRLETVDKIVGVCLAASKTRAWYLPIRHKGDGAKHNIPPRLVMALLKRLRAAGIIFIFHNYKFDVKFLKYDPAGETGDWDEVGTWHDTLILAYLRNSREREKGLKYLSKTFLNREMIELEDLFLREKGKKTRPDFSTLDPSWSPTVWYAASDALNTLELFDFLLPLIMEKDSHGRSQKTIYTIEKLCLVATLWMEQCRIYIDREKLIELIQLGQKEWWDCLQQVYLEVGQALERDIRPGWVLVLDEYFDPKVLSPDYMEAREIARRNAPPDTRVGPKKSVPSLTDPKVRESVDFYATYDVTIPAEFGLMLRELGVPGLQATEKSGQIKTSKDVLEEVIENAGDQFPWMKKVRRFREVTKALSTVLFNLYRDTTPERSPDGTVWANFNGTKVDTGRFSTPTPSESEFHGQVDWNVQSTKAYYYDPKDPPPECVYRQREVVAARPGGYVMFAIDYSGVELRIVTNLSGEPKWLSEFFHCSSCDNTFDRGALPPPFCPSCGSDKIGDLHTLTAISLYNVNPATEDPKAFKVKRQVGKIVNFLLCYGGSGQAVMRQTGCDKEEGWRIKNQFDKAYSGLLRWWKKQHEVARKQEYVTTAFGRKYPVPDIKHEFAQFRSKAERNSVNGPVQGSSADIMKLAMGLLYREFKERGWINRPGQPDLIYMVITIHDELVFEIHESVMDVALPLIDEIMCKRTVKNLDWVVPLKVDMEFGADWTGEYNLTELAWNKSKEPWTPDLVRALPTFYQHYLSVGGKPIDVDAAPSDGPALHPALQPPAASADGKVGGGASGSGKPLVEPLRDGDAFVYQINSRDLTPDLSEKLARVIVAVDGRGVDLIKIRDEYGNDLIGISLRGAWAEFQLKINEVGL